jgi:protein SCO1/2
MSPGISRFLNLTCLGLDSPPALKISDRFPNVTLSNQFGQTFGFRDRFLADGRALIVNTMFTTCRGSCSGTSAILKDLRKTLSPLFGNRLSFISLTLEPLVDTPGKLLDYAKLYGAGNVTDGSCDWQFLTGTRWSVDKLRRALGFYDLDPKRDEDITQHASTLLFGNVTSDRWAALPAALRKPLLIESIRRVAGFTFEQRYGIRR